MSVRSEFKASQRQEEPIRQLCDDRGAFTVKCMYARAKEKQHPDKQGEDFLRVVENDKRLVFALCDGVSTSFVPAEGVQILGNGLVDWLWNLLALQERNEVDLLQEANDVLSGLAKITTQQVQAFSLPENLSRIRRNALEQKRAEGSKSVLICGAIDLLENRALLLWMGDSRLRVWDEEEEWSNELSRDLFRLRDHWSSSCGAVGEIHVILCPAQAIRRLVAYSDGLHPLDHCSDNWPNDEVLKDMVDRLQESPESDDISYVEIILPSSSGRTKHPIRAASYKVSHTATQDVQEDQRGALAQKPEEAELAVEEIVTKPSAAPMEAQPPSELRPAPPAEQASRIPHENQSETNRVPTPPVETGLQSAAQGTMEIKQPLSNPSATRRTRQRGRSASPAGEAQSLKQDVCAVVRIVRGNRLLAIGAALFLCLFATSLMFNLLQIDPSGTDRVEERATRTPQEEVVVKAVETSQFELTSTAVETAIAVPSSTTTETPTVVPSPTPTLTSLPEVPTLRMPVMLTFSVTVTETASFSTPAASETPAPVVDGTGYPAGSMP